MAKLLQIGEVAKMFHISVGTLRHYENAGLLPPEYIDPKTGYRYYGAKQFEMLNTIRYLRMLDMPLAEIADFLHNRDVDIIADKLRGQKDIILKKKRELEQIERKIDHRLATLTKAQAAKLGEIYLHEEKSKRIVRRYDNLRPRNYLDLEGQIRALEAEQVQTTVFLGKVGVGIAREDLLWGQFGQCACVFLLLDEEDDFNGEVEYTADGLYASVCFRGSHTEAQEEYARLIEYIMQNDLAINGHSLEITLIDNGFTNDTSKFVTEISIPIVKK